MVFKVFEDGDDLAVKKLNENFEILESMLGDSDTTGWTVEGVVLMNGAKWYQGKTPRGYRVTRKPNGDLLIQLSVILNGPGVTGKQLVDFPNSVLPDETITAVMGGSTNTIVAWDLKPSSGLFIHGSSGDISWDSAWLPFYKEYTIEKPKS